MEAQTNASMSLELGSRRTSSTAPPPPVIGFRSRRGSRASLSSKGPIDKEALSQALDEIHTTASRSEALTSFSDFDGGANARPGAKELVSGGISGLYTRLRQSVGAGGGGGGGSPEHVRSGSRSSLGGRAETGSVNSSTSSQAKTKPEKDLRSGLLSSVSVAERAPPRNAPLSRGEERASIPGGQDLVEDSHFVSDLHIPTSPSVSRKSSAVTSTSALESSQTALRTDQDRELSLATPNVKAVEGVRFDVGHVALERSVSLGNDRADASSAEDDNAVTSSEESAGELQLANRSSASRSRHSLGTPDSKRETTPSRRTPGRASQRTSRELSKDEAPFMPAGSYADNKSIVVDTRRPLVRINEKALPTVNISTTSSTVDSGDVASRTSTALSTPKGEFPPNLNAGFRRTTQRSQEAQSKSHAIVPAHLKRRVVSKEFWMKDENARDCFYCGDAFSTFRRKHHCRTCGQIFDAKCTTLVSGQPFDLPGTLRLCKPCEGVIYGSDDDSTVFSEEEETVRNSVGGSHRDVGRLRHIDLGNTTPFRPEDAALATPSIGIPASRRKNDPKRRSAVIEFDAHPVLARPSSSRSLKSLGNRPRSTSHRRHQTRPQHLRNLKHLSEERGPFHQDSGDTERRHLLPAFHNDNIIDPDLAQFMSDEGSEEDQASMFTVLNGGSQPSSLVDNEKAGLSSLLTSGAKKARSRIGDRSGTSLAERRDNDHSSRPPTRQGSKLRKRNTSVASTNFPRPSPRRSRSQNLTIQDLDGSIIGDAARNHRDFDDPPHTKFETRIKRSAAMHGSDAPRVELNSASLQHVRKLLAQLLQDNKVPSWRSWEKALLPILLQSTDDVDPDVQRGDDMDVRNYIKLKKIPGGRPGDTAYVSGVVFSKNVALKAMKRNFHRPRIVIVTFAIEYARYNTHFMSLEPVIAQEREYLRNLVGRIVALRPHVLLVQRHVSGLALQMLHEANVTVIYNVKESVLAAVGRVTQTKLIRSVDQLSIDPAHLGQCDNVDVKTYVHSGIKKTYIYISGCQPSLGCTIVLRGGSTETLRQVKRITEFMCYVVYNLKLETCLMRDEFVLIPSQVVEEVPKSSSSGTRDRQSKRSLKANDRLSEIPATDVVTTNDAVVEQHEQTVNTNTKTDELSKLATLVREASTENIEDESMPSQYRDLVQSSRTRLLSSSPFVKFMEPHLLMQAQEQERRVEKYKRLMDAYTNDVESEDEMQDAEKLSSFEMVQPEMVQEVRPNQQSKSMRRFLLDVHRVQYERALKEYEAKKKQWESFFEGSNGNPFDPFTHQNIFVLQSLVSSVTSAPCAGPEVIGLSFYADYEHPEMNYLDDCTLGQFVEDNCLGASTNCKSCNRRMLDHHRQYVHGSGQLSISVTRYPSKIRGLQNSILLWSTCKVCNQETTVIPMSDNTWKYSFGKYLELSFWSTPLKPRAGLCPHDIHKDFIRCFGFQDHCVRVQFDRTEIYEVLVPSATINWAVSADLRLKNQLYSDCMAKLSAFVGSVKKRLESINLSTVTPEKTADATATVEKLVQRAEDDHQELLQTMQAKYMSSRFYEVIPVNQAIRAMDEKAIRWDDAFTEFERSYFPSETDIRRLATLQLKKLFLDRQDLPHADTGDSEEGMEMKENLASHTITLTDEELQSEKAHHMLTAVIEEQIKAESPPPPAEQSPGEPGHFKSMTSQDNQTRGMSIREPEKAVERADVKHLDLAVPTIVGEHHPSPPLGAGDMSTSLPAGPGVEDMLNEQDVFATEPQPLNQTLIERIEQMRSAASGGAEDDSTAQDGKAADSRIPRLAELYKKSIPVGVQPGLFRAQSQPGHIPKRSNELGSIPTIETVASGEGVDTDSTTNTGHGLGLGDIGRSVEQRLIERLSGGASKQAKSSTSLIPRSVPTKVASDNSTRVSALAKHFEQLSREFERERLRERKLRAARSRQNRANHLPSSQPVVEVYKDATEAVDSRPDDNRTPEKQSRDKTRESSGTVSDERDYAKPSSDHSLEQADTTDAEATDNDIASSTLRSSNSDTEADTEAELTDTEQNHESLPRVKSEAAVSSHSTLRSPVTAPEIDLPLPKHEKSSLMKMLSSFWSERSASGWSPLEYPMLATEHVFDDSDIIVREDEPSSVIALALSGNDYLKKLREFRRSPRSRGHHQSGSQSGPSIDDAALQQAAIEASLVSETGTHMKYSFGHNQVRASCKIFYAESFDALRRKCGVSDRFVESLSRSIKWDSKGGKTKSLFLKTLDDRFVIKSLQEVELKAFTRFAPDYFAFMSHTLFHGVPSVIAKMFGLFQVMIKNPATGVEFSSYLLVMENLFYDRKPTRRFDLKGSMRNRKIESTGQPDEVLLDENLVETIFETPLFVREHARKLVKASVWNDTMWLCKQNVMDYSLMAGFDDEKHQLYIGIIDCIRTYTWDKKLESWIKDRGKNKPTITSPKDYRNRFRVSMMQYVLQAPNVYHEFSRQMTAPASLKVVEEQERRRASRGLGDVLEDSGGAVREGDGLLLDEVAMREMGSVIV